MLVKVAIFILWTGFCVFWIYLKTRDIKQGVTGTSGVAIERAKTPFKFWAHIWLNVIVALAFASLATWFLLKPAQ